MTENNKNFLNPFPEAGEYNLITVGFIADSQVREFFQQCHFIIQRVI